MGRVVHNYVQNNGVCMRVTFAEKVSERDWAAYVGCSLEEHEDERMKHFASDTGNPSMTAMNEEEACRHAREYGNKLDEDVAQAMFPGNKEPYRK